MISLARANLIHDWRRHATAIVVLVLAGLLMTTQLGLVAGFAASQGEVQRQLRADFIVKQKQSSAGGRGGLRALFRGQRMEGRHQARVLMHPDVDLVQAYSPNRGGGQWEKDDGSNEFVQLKIVDTDEDSMTFPRQFPDKLREIVEMPGYVIATSVTARKLQVGLGDTGTLNGTKITVGAIVDGMPSGFLVPIFASAQTARLANAAPDDNWPENFLVRLKPDANSDKVQRELNKMLSPINLEVVKPEEFASTAGMTQLLTSTFGWILLGSAAFGLVVGCGIASQTLRGAFLAQLTEFGALRALGVGKGRMAAVAMEQAWWTGLAAIPVAAILAHALRVLARQFDIVIGLPNELLIATSVLLLVVALIAGLISLTAVTRVEPAELLR